jgi:hypothetical protein
MPDSHERHGSGQIRKSGTDQAKFALIGADRLIGERVSR